MANTTNDEPGNEARHTGDRLGFPHPIAPDTPLEDARSTLPEGTVVTHDGSDIAEVTGDGTDEVLGVLLTLPVYGDSSRAGPYVDADKDATVGYRGSYTADLSAYEDGAVTVTVGEYVDDSKKVFVKHNIEGSVYEVMVR
jgi:hypothetical protein